MAFEIVFKSWASLAVNDSNSNGMLLPSQIHCSYSVLFKYSKLQFYNSLLVDCLTLIIIFFRSLVSDPPGQQKLCVNVLRSVVVVIATWFISWETKYSSVVSHNPWLGCNNCLQNANYVLTESGLPLSVGCEMLHNCKNCFLY